MTNLSKIDALRSAASSQRSDATVKEGHVNDVSDLPIEVWAAPTTGSGYFGWVMVRARRVVEYYSFSPSRRRSDGGSAIPPAR